MNRLYYGDNLDVLREHIPSGSVDLVYLDPPFNSNANYNILFKSPAGRAADSQIEAFEDTWHWNDKAESAFHDVMVSGNTDVAELLRAMRGFLKENDMMAYLAMMAVRLIELHRVLKPTGSLYLHCDTAAGHYLKILLDAVFGIDRFQNDITWKRTSAHNDPQRYGRVQDRILFYAKGPTKVFHPQGGQYSPEQLARYKYEDAGGRYKAEQLTAPRPSPTRSFEWRGTHPGIKRQWRFKLEELERLYTEGRILVRADGSPRKDGLKEYIHEVEMPVVQDIWTDIIMGPTSGERLGYPTQKPLALLERIVSASSNPGDVVLDPFCGCGTAVDAAQKLGRQWIGIDVTHLAIGLIERRMKDRYGDALAYEVIGTPNDLASAEKLAADEPHQFQYWITQKIDGQPYQGGRKGADRGVDGYIYFTGHDRKTEAAIVSVKAGRNVGVAMVRDLKGVMEREKAPMGVFVCVVMTTREMEREAAAAGVYEAADGRTYPRLQIFTLAELFQGRRPAIPLLDRAAAYKKATRAEVDAGRQGALL